MLYARYDNKGCALVVQQLKTTFSLLSCTIKRLNY